MFRFIIPEAPSRWPILDLTDPIHNGSRTVLFEPSTLRIAVASIGSPTLVPVPCASTKPHSLGSSPAFP